MSDVFGMSMAIARSTGDVRPKPSRGERCALCPAHEAHACPGVKARRLCDLIDPAHGAHRPQYRESIRSAAAQAAGAIPRPEFPSIPTQAANVARALWDWATSGFKMASEEEVARRRTICAACPEWVPKIKRCRICGCKTEAKIQMKTEHCPLDPPRWGPAT